MRTRLVAGLVLMVACAGAQNPPEVIGTVREPGPNGGIPIAGVAVTLTEFALVDNVVTPKVYGRAMTDTSGAFRFRPERLGNYLIEAAMQGYSAAAPPRQNGLIIPDSTERVFSLTRDQPKHEVTFWLTRPGEVTGRVIDENGEPMPKVALRVFDPRRPALLPINGETLNDGSFAVTISVAGNYVIRPLPRDFERVKLKFTAEDLQTLEEGWEPSYWPGGSPDLQAAAPLPLRLGASVSAGTIRLHKIRYPGVLIHVGNIACGEEDRLTLTLSRPVPPSGLRDSFDFVQARDLPCATELLLREAPGDYQLSLLVGPPRDPGFWAFAPLTMGNRNSELSVAMAPMTSITGRFLAAEGAKLPSFEKISGRLMPVDRGLDGAAISIPPDGTLNVYRIAGPRHSLLLTGITPSHYVQEIRVNGRAAADGIVMLAGGPAQMEIVLDDRPATITGLIDGAKGGIVMAVGGGSTERTAVADANGTFRLAGLPPGEYRVFAIPADSRARLTEVGVVARLAANAERVTLDRGGSRSVTLKLSDPNR